MQLIGVASVNGHRCELILEVPDDAAASLGTGRADERLRAWLSQEAQRAAEIVAVAAHDAVAEARAKAEAKKTPATGKRGPDQVAFAGSKEPAVALPKAKGQ
jgi:hypothetical protein